MRPSQSINSVKEDKASAVSEGHPRIARENKTIEAMIRMLCRDQHHTPEGLCRECAALVAYARERLTRCPYQEGKTTCARCQIYCYKPTMREKVRAVMRYAGPRMMYRHPILALYHLIDGRRTEPIEPECDEESEEKTL